MSLWILPLIDTTPHDFHCDFWTFGKPILPIFYKDKRVVLSILVRGRKTLDSTQNNSLYFVVFLNSKKMFTFYFLFSNCYHNFVIGWIVERMTVFVGFLPTKGRVKVVLSLLLDASPKISGFMFFQLFGLPCSTMSSPLANMPLPIAGVFSPLACFFLL